MFYPSATLSSVGAVKIRLEEIEKFWNFENGTSKASPPKNGKTEIKTTGTISGQSGKRKQRSEFPRENSKRARMSVIRESLLNNLFHDEQAFRRMPSSDFPSMRSGLSCDLVESKEKNAFVAHFDVPGVPKEHIKVNLDDKKVLTITVDFRKGRNSAVGDKTHWQERTSGHVSRSIKLPEDIDVQKIKASQKDGVLELEIPKLEVTQSKVHSITVN